MTPFPWRTASFSWRDAPPFPGVDGGRPGMLPIGQSPERFHAWRHPCRTVLGAGTIHAVTFDFSRCIPLSNHDGFALLFTDNSMALVYIGGDIAILIPRTLWKIMEIRHAQIE